MDSRQILRLVHQAILNGQATPEELVQLLEITTEDLLWKFPKKLVENAEKFGIYGDQDEDSVE